MKIAVKGQAIALVKDDTLVRNSGKTYSVTFVFDEAWDGFAKTAHFQAGSVTASAALTNDQCNIPAECLENAGVMLKVLVSAVNGSAEKATAWCLTSRILYDTSIDIPIPPSPSPTPSGEVGRLCSDFAEVLNNEYSEKELKDKSLTEVLTEIEEEYVPTATDSEVEDVLDEVWGPN